jgi:hypothetical protein
MTDKPWHQMTKQEWAAASVAAVTQEKATHPQPSKKETPVKTNAATKPAPAAPKPATKPATPPPAPPAKASRPSDKKGVLIPGSITSPKAPTKLAAHKLSAGAGQDLATVRRPQAPKPSEGATSHHPGKPKVFRICNLPTCGKEFKPVEVLSGKSTQMYCSEEHAADALRAKGLLPPKKVETPEETKAARKRQAVTRKTIKAAKPKAAKSKKVAHTAAALTQKYGPSRQVKRIIGKAGGKKSMRALLECGHEQTVPSEGTTAWRCGKCKSGAPTAKAAAKAEAKAPKKATKASKKAKAVRKAA